MPNQLEPDCLKIHSPSRYDSCGGINNKEEVFLQVLNHISLISKTLIL
ncbi:MAG: hypothetical protein V7K31_01700 [Nostoc sp.]